MNTEKQYTNQVTDTHQVCVAWVQPRSRVLELGCAAGVLSREMVKTGCAVTGIELSEASAVLAKENCEQLICGDIEDEAVWKAVVGPFDAVVCADVLEHLRDPAKVLRRIRPLLASGGRLIVAVPNVAHYSVRWSLLLGRFEYGEFGILDSTHLRFYTRASLEKMIRDQGFAIREAIGNVPPFPGDTLARRAGLWWAKRFFNGILRLALPDATVFKWCVMAEVDHGAGSYRAPPLEEEQ